MSLKNQLIYTISVNDTELKSADFCEDSFTDEEFIQLCKAISRNTHLEYLSLLHSNINARHLRPLLNAVTKNHTLHTIKLSKYLDYSKQSMDIINDIERHVSLNTIT